MSMRGAGGGVCEPISGLRAAVPVFSVAHKRDRLLPALIRKNKNSSNEVRTPEIGLHIGIFTDPFVPPHLQTIKAGHWKTCAGMVPGAFWPVNKYPPAGR
ncbi:hypothetical protein [Burkholderia metallica]|uniref:hypothetical protein n=1 Tax=Burkholderia metallica TaxID=488729 RepID=UPI00131EA63F|nr:hypothetical protein [Burkholderia metallica]